MTRNTSFYYSFLVLPAEERRAITAVFDVCRAIDDAVDLQSEPQLARAALEQWREEIARVFGTDAPRTPQGRALQPFVSRFRLPRAQFEALIEGVGMDVEPIRFASFAQLEPYCHRAASSVGLMCAEIFGYSDPRTIAYATDLGVALQLTNILRDVGVDYGRGRLYLPLETLAASGASEADVRREVEGAGRGVQSAAVKRALIAHAALAREYFTRASASLPDQDARRFLAAEIMHGVYFEMLREIEAADFDVFSRVIRLSRPRQAVIAARTWWRLRTS